MLEEALKMVSVLEVEYGKIKMENTRLRYKLNDYWETIKLIILHVSHFNMKIIVHY